MIGNRVLKVIGACAVCVGSLVSGAMAAQSIGEFVPNNVPGFVKGAEHLALTDTGKTIDVVVWLKLRNQAALDQMAAAVYDPRSPRYHQWLKAGDFGNSYAPTPAAAATVQTFLKSHGLSITEMGPKSMYVRARGTVANVNKAFQVQLQDFQLDGGIVYANTTAPVISGAAGPLVRSVHGLHNLQYTHPNLIQSAVPKKPSAKSSPATERAITAATAPPISSDCFTGVETEKFKNNGNSYPHVTIQGNSYAKNAGALGGCGYTPREIQTAYNLTKLYKEGLDGAGQTIVIIDWCGSPTIRSDANAFSAAYDLPPLTHDNFKIINSSTAPTCGAPDVEIDIDVEWAHAIAPGANIDLVVPPSASFADVDTAEFFAVINKLGSVISGSYSSEELYDAPAELATESLINEIAAVQGISANFSTGDAGDATFDDPGLPASVPAPADSPYATGVGGISLALKPDKSIAWQSGWGNNFTPIVSQATVIDPPNEASYFGSGSGGGTSAVFAKPAYQHKLKGSGRQLPDISWLADPYTGAVVVTSVPYQYPSQVYEIVGGTSVACPMFSALWAIANQAAGVWLGQASQYVYSMPAATIMDVLPITSKTNVTAIYQESPNTTEIYKASDLAGPLENTTQFLSAIMHVPLLQDTAFVVTFDTDSGLKTTAGWDNVTGVGVPNGKAFADHFKP